MILEILHCSHVSLDCLYYVGTALNQRCQFIKMRAQKCMQTG